jgi:hypothetical protein
MLHYATQRTTGMLNTSCGVMRKASGRTDATQHRNASQAPDESTNARRSGPKQHAFTQDLVDRRVRPGHRLVHPHPTSCLRHPLSPPARHLAHLTRWMRTTPRWRRSRQFAKCIDVHRRLVPGQTQRSGSIGRGRHSRHAWERRGLKAFKDEGERRMQQPLLLSHHALSRRHWLLRLD